MQPSSSTWVAFLATVILGAFSTLFPPASGGTEPVRRGAPVPVDTVVPPALDAEPPARDVRSSIEPRDEAPTLPVVPAGGHRRTGHEGN